MTRFPHCREKKFEPQAAQPFHGSFWLQCLIVEAKQLYTETLLHTKSQHRDAFTSRRCYTQSPWHDRQMLLRTDAFIHRSLYTQALLHTNISTEKHFYTQTLVQTNIFTKRFFLCALCSVCCIWELCTTESNFSLLAASPQQPIRLLRLGGLTQKYYMANLRNFVVSRW